MNLNDIWDKIRDPNTDTVEDFGDILQWLLPVIGLTAAIASGGKEFIFLLQWFYSTGGQAISSTLLKRLFNFTSLGRRPNGGENSMPSGHTSAAFSGASFAAFTGSPFLFSVLLFLLAAFTGYSRIRANKHRLRDVIAGASLGTAISAVCIFLL